MFFMESIIISIYRITPHSNICPLHVSFMYYPLVQCMFCNFCPYMLSKILSHTP